MKLYRLLLVGLLALASCAQQGAPNSQVAVGKSDEALFLPRAPLVGWSLSEKPMLPAARIDSRSPFGGGDFSWVEPSVEGGFHVLQLPRLASFEYRRIVAADDVDEIKLIMVMPALPERGAALMARIVDRCQEPLRLLDVPTSYDRVNGYSSTVRMLTCKESGETITRMWQIIDGLEYSYIISQKALWKKDSLSFNRMSELMTGMAAFLSGNRVSVPGVVVCDYARTAERCKAVEQQFHVFRNQQRVGDRPT